MKKYQLKVYGWELNASAHSLTNQEVQVVKEYQEDNRYDDLSEVAWELESIIEGYEPFSTNMWVITKPFYSDKLTFTITDENGEEVTEFSLNDITNHSEIDEDYEGENYQGYPLENKNENILLFLEENKGLVCEFNFESEETPTSKDFSYLVGSVETPDGDWDLIDKMFFKGTELEENFDNQNTTGKALTVQLWTLNNIN